MVIAKLDRLSRSLAFIATLMEAGIEFVAVDNPHANNLTVHILAAMAQYESKYRSARETHYRPPGRGAPNWAIRGSPKLLGLGSRRSRRQPTGSPPTCCP
jgi:DNA invertase Pin-like site-specific DNA recombinase